MCQVFLLFPKMVRTLGQMIQANKHIAWDIPETPNNKVFFFFLFVCLFFVYFKYKAGLTLKTQSS